MLREGECFLLPFDMMNIVESLDPNVQQAEYSEGGGVLSIMGYRGRLPPKEGAFALSL